MIKHLLLLFNFLFFFIFSALLPADVIVEDNMPNELKRDSTYLVEVTLNKGALFGFAKFQINLPPGFDVEPVETAEASFTYSDQKIKYIWMALPEAETIVLSYKLTPREGAPESGVVEGKFSYIEENERKSYDMPNRTIAVTSPDDEETGPLPAMATIKRTVTPIGASEYEVSLLLELQGIEGFAKVEEFLPEGAQASAGETKMAVFSQVDEKAKFVWMSIPQEGSLNVSYTVKADRDIADALNAMDGMFSYLDGSETMQVPVHGSGQPALVSEADAQEDIAQSEVPEESIEKNSVEPQEDGETHAPDAENLENEVVTAEAFQLPEVETSTGETLEEVGTADSKNVTTIPDPQTGIVYRVQIMAGHKAVSEKFVRDKYKFQDNYTVDNHEGWIKYLTGSFDVYRSARDKREALVTAGHNFPGPFVTAYNEGTRITVQEALMITNQKWFK